MFLWRNVFLYAVGLVFDTKYTIGFVTESGVILIVLDRFNKSNQGQYNS